MNELVAMELKLEVVKRRMTQGLLAEALGVSRGYVGNILNGRTPLTFPMVERIASALSADPSDIVEKALRAKAVAS